MRRGVAICLVLVGLTIASSGHAADDLVIVARADSPIESLSNLDLKKIYLGIAVRIDGETIRGVRNVSDELLDRIFLQNIVAMSERTYQRRLLSFTLRYGRPRPPEISSLEELLERLSANPYAVSYMWKADAEARKEIRILRTIWRG
jgi:hypothetical protein